MAASSPPCQLTASKLRRMRAAKTKQKLHDLAHQSDSLQHVYSQLAMLTSAVHSLASMLMHSRGESAQCSNWMDQTWYGEGFFKHDYFPENPEVDVGGNSPSDQETDQDEPRLCEVPQTFAEEQTGSEPLDSSASTLSHVLSDASLQTPAISSSSIAEITDHVDQALVRAVELYDSCPALVAVMVDGCTLKLVQVPRDALSQMLTTLRGQKVQVKSHLGKLLHPPGSAGSGSDHNNVGIASADGVSKEVAEFTLAQVYCIVDSIIDGFVDKVVGSSGYSASDFAEVAEAAKESLGNLEEDDGKTKFTRVHVRQLMGILARSCQRHLERDK